MRDGVALLLVALAAAGCGGSATAPAPSVPPAPAGLPPSHPPLERRMPADAAHGAADAHGRIGVSADRFHAQEGWVAEKPSGSMRLLQFRLPAKEAGGKDAEVAVYGEAMGDTKANIERWRGQFSPVTAGKDSLEEITAGVRGKVTLLDISGMYAGMGMPGAGGPKGPGETRMIAAIVESPDGTFYVKATGAPAAMEPWAKSVRAFILDAAK